MMVVACHRTLNFGTHLSVYVAKTTEDARFIPSSKNWILFYKLI